MFSNAHYARVGSDHEDRDLEAHELREGIANPTRKSGAGWTQSSTSSDAELDINTRGTPNKIESPPNFRALTLFDSILGAKSRPEWQNPVRWCLWGNAAVLILNIVFTIAAIGISASSQSRLGFATITLYHGSCSTTQRMKIGFHLLINIFSVASIATSSYCCAILMAPSRTDIDTAHSNGNWLSIGVSSWRNFRNLKGSSRALWTWLLFTSILMQMVYNSIIYSSLNANVYPALVAPAEFVSNSSLPTSFFEEQSCWPEDMLSWNITNLRSQILDGNFERLNRDDCIAEYANNYVTSRGTVVALPHGSMTYENTPDISQPINGTGIWLLGYGYPGGIRALNQDSHNHLINSDAVNPIGYEWMCQDTRQACLGASLLKSHSWSVSGQPWALKTTVRLFPPNTKFEPEIFITGQDITMKRKTFVEGQLNYLYPDATPKQVEAFLSYVQSNPPPEYILAYLNSTSWITSPPHATVAPPKASASCPAKSTLSSPDKPTLGGKLSSNPELAVNVDHCWSQKTLEECRLFFHLPIAVVIIICSSIKIVCIWLLLRIDRRDLFLTIGDAISSFLQRPDPTTKYWCTLSPDLITANKDCPWNPDRKSSAQEIPWSQEPHPDRLPKLGKSWLSASSAKIWCLAFLVMVSYVVLSLLLPLSAVRNVRTQVRRFYSGNLQAPLPAIWQIKGWGVIQSTALLSNFGSTFVGMELLANTPQLVVSLLYFCFNDTLTRAILAAEYNDYAIHRRPLRVTFPRGEQRSTWYLTIPYQYAIPLLTTFTLAHWFISEGLFYVQILPYDPHGRPIYSHRLVTCGVSTIPLETALFLIIVLFFVIAFSGARKFKAPRMPIAFECSVAISAACHPPHHDLDAAFRAVQWGVVEQDPDALYPHCSFTSKDVTEPEEGVQYA